MILLSTWARGCECIPGKGGSRAEDTAFVSLIHDPHFPAPTTPVQPRHGGRRSAWLLQHLAGAARGLGGRAGVKGAWPLEGLAVVQGERSRVEPMLCTVR